MIKIIVRVNCNGRRIGEDHPNARFSNDEVDKMRDLYDDGKTITDIAKMLKTSKGYVHDVVNCRRRAETMVATRVVRSSSQGEL